MQNVKASTRKSKGLNSNRVIAGAVAKERERFFRLAEQLGKSTHQIQQTVFAPLRDVKYFQRFFLDGGTVAWPNGADIAPEALYEAEDVGLVTSKARSASARRVGRLAAASR